MFWMEKMIGAYKSDTLTSVWFQSYRVCGTVRQPVAIRIICNFANIWGSIEIMEKTNQGWINIDIGIDGIDIYPIQFANCDRLRTRMLFISSMK